MNSNQPNLKFLLARTLLFIACGSPLFPVAAQNVPESELPFYTQYCLGENDRAVWYEPLIGRLEGYGSLVCLDEPTQQTAQWLVTPDGKTISWDDQPESTLPPEGMFDERMLELLDDSAAAINIDNTATHWINLILIIVEPQLQETSYSAGSEIRGPDDPIIYTLNGEVATEAEIIAFNEMIDEERKRNNKLRFEIKSEDRRRVVQQLMEINSWHGRVDVEQFITQDTDVLGLPLTRSEILFLRDTSESLVSRAIPGEDPASIIFTDGATTNIQQESLTDSNTAQLTNTDLTTNVNSGGGAILWVGGLIFITLGRSIVTRVQGMSRPC